MGALIEFAIGGNVRLISSGTLEEIPDGPPPTFVTFTGIDATTDLDAAVELTHRYPVEFAVLFSPKHQGNVPRYPEMSVVQTIQSAGFTRLAAHLCGQYCRDIMAGVDPQIDLKGFHRVQSNTGIPDPERIAEFSASQKIQAIARTGDKTFSEDRRISWLYDCSGGKGIVADSWPPHPGGNTPVGYAGGITPENVREILSQIDSAGPYWIDMETGIRTDERFDLEKCQRVCRAIWG